MINIRDVVAQGIEQNIDSAFQNAKFAKKINLNQSLDAKLKEFTQVEKGTKSLEVRLEDGTILAPSKELSDAERLISQQNQIEYIKDEKLPVIVNSNGMSGFTHIYEIGEDTLKISSYYDILSIDFSLVDKNDNKSNPISYVNLKSNTTYKDLKEDLEKNGYKCTPSK